MNESGESQEGQWNKRQRLLASCPKRHTCCRCAPDKRDVEVVSTRCGTHSPRPPCEPQALVSASTRTSCPAAEKPLPSGQCHTSTRPPRMLGADLRTRTCDRVQGRQAPARNSPALNLSRPKFDGFSVKPRSAASCWWPSRGPCHTVLDNVTRIAQQQVLASATSSCFLKASAELSPVMFGLCLGF